MSSIRSVQKIIDHIEERLCEPFDLKDLAAAAFMSVPSLYRVFYALTGHPIMEYIRKRRINVSAWHLRYSEKSVIDVAIECGFDSYRAYAKAFKKLVGMTPGAYRRAVVHYSFEAIDLLQHVAYLEEKELSERHPDVKVIRLWPARVFVYRHRSSNQRGIEDEALKVVFNGLQFAGHGFDRIRFFGYNVDLPSTETPYGYDIMIPYDGNSSGLLNEKLFHLETFPGGLYAVGKCAETNGPQIVAAWNRLLSEWLPRSTFELGEHRYIEEFLTYQGHVVRMKLYLPVTRKLEPDTQHIVTVEPIVALAFRAYGPDGAKDADDRLSSWLAERIDECNPMARRLFMSYSFGIEPSEEYWYELSVTVSEQEQERESVAGLSTRRNAIGGGLYACLVSGAYGLMGGVLERMHRWLHMNEAYEADESRQWFAEYAWDEGSDIERSASTRCYIPIKPITK
ncbi:AraC family transcriptional regulator [Paenibacillus thermotolerans]|uniref:AraC family transcriptional regulator n=1 Tax=Paenibacillus thermotolerans TaxID=3027807 RepID=UPI00236865D0|nr:MULTISPECIES: AraC family transcriptional regulator [unclassified Paenibacillus]